MQMFSAILLKVDVFTISIIGRSHSNDLNSVNVNEIESYRVDKGKRAVFVENSRKNAVICFDEWVYFIWNSLYIASNAEKASIVSTEHTFIHIPNSQNTTLKNLSKKIKCYTFRNSWGWLFDFNCCILLALAKAGSKMPSWIFILTFSVPSICHRTLAIGSPKSKW